VARPDAARHIARVIGERLNLKEEKIASEPLS
jgi:hypothetical protein